MIKLRIGIFGNPEYSEKLIKKLGKKGTSNDIEIYNHYSSEGELNYITPKSQKISSLLQAISLSEIPVIAINEINAELGEQLIAIDMFGFEKGFIISECDLSIIKNTSLEKFEIINENQIREKILEIKIERKEKPDKVFIDNYFDVKSVGFVVLGFVESGKIKKHDKINMEPLGKEVLVKSIQSNDKDISEADAGKRVGLNLKGVTSEEMKRGYVLCNEIEKSKTIEFEFRKSDFYKKEIKEGDQLSILSGLIFSTGIVKKIENDKIEIELNSEVPYSKDTKFIIASTENNLPRIIGSAKIPK